MLIGGVSWVVLCYLALPLIVVIAISFTTTSYLSFPPVGATLRWYANVLGDPTFIEAFVLSGQLAAVATLVALLLGAPRRSRRPRDALRHENDACFARRLRAGARGGGAGSWRQSHRGLLPDHA